MTVTNEQIQALKAAAESCDKQEPLSLVVYHGKMCLRNKGGIVFKVLRDICFPEYSAENENYARLAELCTPDFILYLLAERDADKALIANLTSERDALREGEMGDGKYSNTRAAADIYFQLAEECDIPPGGSLVQHIDMMRDRIAELEASLKAAEINETDARCHVAELQDRTLTVKLPRDITHVTNKYFEDGRDAVIEAIESQLAAAGIKLQIKE